MESLIEDVEDYFLRKTTLEILGSREWKKLPRKLKEEIANKSKNNKPEFYSLVWDDLNSNPEKESKSWIDFYLYAINKRFLANKQEKINHLNKIIEYNKSKNASFSYKDQVTFELIDKWVKETVQSIENNQFVIDETDFFLEADRYFNDLMRQRNAAKKILDADPVVDSYQECLAFIYYFILTPQENSNSEDFAIIGKYQLEEQFKKFWNEQDVKREDLNKLVEKLSKEIDKYKNLILGTESNLVIIGEEYVFGRRYYSKQLIYNKRLIELITDFIGYLNKYYLKRESNLPAKFIDAIVDQDLFEKILKELKNIKRISGRKNNYKWEDSGVNLDFFLKKLDEFTLLDPVYSSNRTGYGRLIMKFFNFHCNESVFRKNTDEIENPFDFLSGIKSSK